MKTYGRLDASYGMLRYLDNLEDDELVAVVFEMRLLQDEHGHEWTGDAGILSAAWCVGKSE